MAGFFDRFASAYQGNIKTVSKLVKTASSLGMYYDDMVVKNSMSVGPTEAMFANKGAETEGFMYSLAMSDIGPKKYIAAFDKDIEEKRKYLIKFAMNGEIEFILDSVSDEAIVYDDQNFFCRPYFLNTYDFNEKFEEELNDEFKRIYNLFHFNDDISAWNYFRAFLIEGFLAFEIILDDKQKRIIGFKELDPISLRPDVEKTDQGYVKVWHQYEKIPSKYRKLYDANVIYISYAKSNNMKSRVSYCERMVRSFNLLRIMENSRVIWAIMNSTWRMKMVVPIGTKSETRARQTLAEMRSIYKEDITLDSDSGELFINGKSGMQLYKNYIVPSKNGEQIELDSVSYDGPDLSDMESVKYFYNKLKRDSKLPFSRFDDDSGGGSITIGSADGTEREELRFSKFINRLRSIFQEILWKPLWYQMILNHPELREDLSFRSSVGIKYEEENAYKEAKDSEMMDKRIDRIEKLYGLEDKDGDKIFPMDYLIKKYLDMNPDEERELEEAKNKAKKKAESGGDGGGEAAGGLDLNF